MLEEPVSTESSPVEKSSSKVNPAAITKEIKMSELSAADVAAVTRNHDHNHGVIEARLIERQALNGGKIDGITNQLLMQEHSRTRRMIDELKERVLVDNSILKDMLKTNQLEVRETKHELVEQALREENRRLRTRLIKDDV